LFAGNFSGRPQNPEDSVQINIVAVVVLLLVRKRKHPLPLPPPILYLESKRASGPFPFGISGHVGRNRESRRFF
jgi:hypothetical protein